jgi:hypothetical protein
MRKMGMAGIGFSAFSAGMLGGVRPFNINMAHAAENNTPDDVANFFAKPENNSLEQRSAILQKQRHQPIFLTSLKVNLPN